MDFDIPMSVIRAKGERHQRALQAEVQAFREQQRAGPARGEMRGGTGRLLMRVPAKCFYNAVAGHGVDPDDVSYFKDMAKRMAPEMIVGGSGKVRVGGAVGVRGTRVGEVTKGRMTKCGRATWSKNYGVLK